MSDPARAAGSAGVGERSRCLSRGLAVLRSLNAGGPASAAEIGARTGVPRPTVHRLLLALQDEGLVRRQGASDVFAVDAGVLALASGWTEARRALAFASDLAKQTATRVRWPLDLATYDRGAMAIGFSTHDRAPWSLLPRSPTGRRVPLHGSAPGRIYMASAPDDLRTALLAGADPAEHELVAAARAQGYAYRDGGLVPRTLSLAVAVNGGGGPMLCVCMSFMRSAMTLDAAVREHLGLLRSLAADTEAALACA